MKKRIIKIIAVALLCVIIIIVALVTPYAIAIINTFQTAESQSGIVEYLGSFGAGGIPVLIALQALQIVIAFLPGGLVEIAGGMLYGYLIGTIISLAGVVLGTVAAFFLAQKLGRPFVKKMVSEKSFDKYSKLCSNKKLEFLILVLFFLPGIPKDILIYVIGTGSPSAKLWVMTSIARVPSIIVAVYAGSLFGQGNFSTSLIVYVLFLLTGCIGILVHKLVMKNIEKNENKQ